MKKKFQILTIASLAMMAAVLTTGCSDDDDNNTPLDPSEVVEEGAEDIADGVMYRVVRADSLDQFKMPLKVLTKVDITPEKNDYYGAKIVEENGTKYVVPVQKKAQDKPLVAVRVKVSPRTNPELGRNVFLLFYNPDAVPASAKTRASTADNVYRRWIGRPMNYWQGLTPKSDKVIISYDDIITLGDTLLVETPPQVKEFCVEYSGATCEETTHAFAANVGVSWKTSRKRLLATPATPAAQQTEDGLWEAVKPSNKAKSGTLDFGVAGSFNTSNSYEYYINMYRNQLMDVALNMGRFEANDNGGIPDAALLWKLTNKDFRNAIEAVKDPNTFNTTTFYNSWGTDVITQGRFGGCYYYVYGRRENAYETSVDVDAVANFKTAYPNSSGTNGQNQWLLIFQLKNSDFVSSSASATYNYDHYYEASRAQKFELTVGGNLHTANDISTWISGFSDKSNWQLISYRVGDDDPTYSTDDFVSGQALPADGPYTYPIDQYIYNMAEGFELSLGSEALPLDKEQIAKWKKIAQKLADARVDYIASHALPLYEKPRLVIADFMMKNGDNGNQKGDPNPFIAEDPREAGKYRIYYPMMAHPQNAPIDGGYAFESSQSTYAVDPSDSKDEYWYYALASEDDCTGIVDIIFHNKNKKYYEDRGDNAQEAHPGYLINNNVVKVKYFDAGSDNAQDKITAIALVEPMKKSVDTDHIYACTGGSELKRSATQSETRKWEDWWNQEMKVSDNDYDEYWYEGGISNPHELIPVYSTKTLPIDRVNEKTICHPLKWGQ